MAQNPEKELAKTVLKYFALCSEAIAWVDTANISQAADAWIACSRPDWLYTFLVVQSTTWEKTQISIELLDLLRSELTLAALPEGDAAALRALYQRIQISYGEQTVTIQTLLEGLQQVTPNMGNIPFLRAGTALAHARVDGTLRSAAIEVAAVLVLLRSVRKMTLMATEEAALVGDIHTAHPWSSLNGARAVELSLRARLLPDRSPTPARVGP